MLELIEDMQNQQDKQRNNEIEDVEYANPLDEKKDKILWFLEEGEFLTIEVLPVNLRELGEVFLMIKDELGKTDFDWGDKFKHNLTDFIDILLQYKGDIIPHKIKESLLGLNKDMKHLSKKGLILVLTHIIEQLQKIISSATVDNLEERYDTGNFIEKEKESPNIDDDDLLDEKDIISVAKIFDYVDDGGPLDYRAKDLKELAIVMTRFAEEFQYLDYNTDVMVKIRYKKLLKHILDNHDFLSKFLKDNLATYIESLDELKKKVQVTSALNKIIGNMRGLS